MILLKCQKIDLRLEKIFVDILKYLAYNYNI